MAITSGSVDFYLIDRDGSNAGKWYRGADPSWQAAESVAVQATHEANGHWKATIPSAVWEDATRYFLYAKDQADDHISIGADILGQYDFLSQIGITAGGTWTMAKLLKVMVAFAAGKWQDKSGEAGTFEVLDAEDVSTVVLEITPAAVSPQKVVSIL